MPPPDDSHPAPPTPNAPPPTWHPHTRLVHAGTWRSTVGELSEALFLTQSYRYNTAQEAQDRFQGDTPGYIYSRYANPTVSMFERRIADIEGMECAYGTASGMAAVSAALLCQLRAGDHVVSARELFGSCLYVVEDLLPRYGIDVTLVTGTDIAAWRSAVRPGTRVCFFETPTNPTLDIIDIAAVSEISHSVGAIVIVDNVFATPLWQRPGRHGADIVVYSATKHIDGQGRCLGGVIAGERAFLDEHLKPFLRHVGPALSPFNAWVMLKGLETLAVRAERQCHNASALATWLASEPQLLAVLYPHLPSHPGYELARRQMERGSTLVSFVVPGGRSGAFLFCDSLSLIQISNNLGDTRSLIVHPASTTHQRLSPEFRESLGISEGLLRLSVGIEALDDLKYDLERALRIVCRAHASGGTS